MAERDLATDVVDSGPGEAVSVAADDVALPVAEPGAPPALDDALVEGMVREIIARAEAARG